MLPSSSNFTSEINGTSDISVWNHPYDDITSAVLKVEWEFQIEAREWGIKGLGISIKRVYGELEVEKYPNEDAEYPDEETVDFDTNENGDGDWKIETEIQVENPFVSDIFPNEVEIDWEKRKVTVIF